MKMYELEIEFDITLELIKLSNVMKSVGLDEQAIIKHQKITLTETIAMIPDEDYLNKVCEIIKDKYKSEEFRIVECKFNCYKKFLEKEI